MRSVSIAPMMDCTDRHFRRFIRIISRDTWLYSEMITTGAIIHGDRPRHLDFNAEENPLALQLGGSDPNALAECAKIGEAWGYSEINLNVGCPSDRVQAGRFGACLMKEPFLVAEAVEKMSAVVNIPVTVKTRIGVDEQDSYKALCDFVETVMQAGCATFIFHARKAWLKGLSPKENRTVPPLNYDRVYQIKHDYPSLEVIINGGITSIEAMHSHLNHVDGVMLGREAYSNPYLLASVDNDFYGKDAPIKSRRDVVLEYFPYLIEQHSKGVPLRHLTKHLIGLFQGVPGAKAWRRYLSENSGKKEVELFVRDICNILDGC